MINLILIFPLIACIILYVFKKDFLNTLMVTLYAILHALISMSFLFGYNFLPNWENSDFFGINVLNEIFLIVLSVVFLAVAVYNSAYLKNPDIDSKKARHYSYMLLLFVFSMTGAILSMNLGISWVFIEGTTLASAYLIYFDKTKHSIEAAWKYVFICSIGIALAFVGILLLTVSTGNLNSLYYDDLIRYAQWFNPFWLKLSFVFILFGIGTKMGLAPVHFWLPDAHAEAPSPVSALLSAALLNSAFFIIVAVYTVMNASAQGDYARLMLITMGVLSLFVAAVFIYRINNYKRMLAYSTIENMGILVIGLAIGGAGAVAAILHMIGHSFTKAAFFLTSGNILKIYNSKKIKSVMGLIKTDKKTGWLWILSFICIAPFPPSLMFISEFMLVKEMLAKNHPILTALILILLTIILYGLAKPVMRMCFSKSSDKPDNKLCGKLSDIRYYLPQALLLTAVFGLGLFMKRPLADLITQAMAGL